MKIKSLILSVIYPFLRKYYSLKLATTPEEKSAIYKHRYKIYRKELAHCFWDTDTHGNNSITDKYDELENALIVYAKNRNNKIIGTIRIVIWKKDQFPKELQNKFSISEEIKNKFDQLGEIRFFQVNHSYRKSLLGLTLILFMNECIIHHSTAETLVFSDSQPGLLKHYFSIGGFSYTQNIIEDKYNFLLIPFAYNMFDIHHFKKISSPIYHSIKKSFKEFQKKNTESAKLIAKRDFSKDIPHVNLYATPDQIIEFRNNLSSDKLKTRFDYIIGLLKKALILRLKKDTTIINSEIVDYDIYMLLKGKLNVYFQDKLIAEINSGEIFGEVSFFSDEHKRMSDVRCSTDVEILLIPRNLLTHLVQTNPQAAIKLLRLLSASIAEKLLVSNTLLSKRGNL